MYEELKDLFTVTLAKRLTSPFLSTFIFASCVTNYDITLLIFSGTDWNTKSTYISGIVNSIPLMTPWDSYRVASPLLVSAFYVVLWPLLDMVFYSISKGWNILYKMVKNFLEKVTPITPEQRQKIEDKLDITINGLRDEVTSKESKLLEVEKRYNVALSNIGEKDEAIESLRLDIVQKDQIILDLQSELSECMVGKGNNETPNEVEKSDTEDTEDTNKDTNKDKEYNFTFRISDEVRKNESLKGNNYDSDIDLNFDRSDISPEMFDAFHEVNYSGKLGALPLGEKIRINIPNISNLGLELSKYSTWYLDVSPEKLTDLEILDKWYLDYKENNDEARLDDNIENQSHPEQEKNTATEFSFNYLTSKKVIKEEARKENYIKSKRSLTFRQNEIEKDVYNAIFEDFYDESKGRIVDNQTLFIRKPRVSEYGSLEIYANGWEIDKNPENLTISKILDTWYSDYCDSKDEIEAFKDKLSEDKKIKAEQLEANEELRSKRRKAASSPSFRP